MVRTTQVTESPRSLSISVNSQSKTVLSVELDILAIGRMLKLLLCFFSSRKFFGFGFVKRLEKQQLSVVWASPRRAH
jgi:hypothetical protein